MGFLDADKDDLDGANTYKVTLPPNIPAKNFWSFTLYDNQTRSMLETPQRFPRAGSQSYPTPAAVANADGSTTFSRSSMALEKPSMPSFNLSVAILSAACILSKVALSIVSFLMSIFAALAGSSLRSSVPSADSNSWSSFGAMVSRSQPASSIISLMLRKLAPMTTVL